MERQDTRSIKLDKFSISDYKLDFGLQYTYKLNKKNTINVGAVYTLGHTLHGDAYKYHQTGTESNGSIYVQSQTGDTIPNPFKMPHTFGAGLTYVYDNRLTIGVDYTLQKWNTADLTWSKFNKESVEMNNRTKNSFWCGIRTKLYQPQLSEAYPLPYGSLLFNSL